MTSSPWGCCRSRRSTRCVGDPADPRTRRLIDGVGASRGTATASAVRPWAVRSRSRPSTRAIRWVDAMCVGLVRADRTPPRPGRGARQSGLLRGQQDRARRHPRRHHGVGHLRRARRGAETRRAGRPSFTEKLLLEACLEAMASGAWWSASRTWVRRLLHLEGRAAADGDDLSDACTQPEKGMTPYARPSESQERMLIVRRGGRR